MISTGNVPVDTYHIATQQVNGESMFVRIRSLPDDKKNY